MCFTSKDFKSLKQHLKKIWWNKDANSICFSIYLEKWFNKYLRNNDYKTFLKNNHNFVVYHFRLEF